MAADKFTKKAMAESPSPAADAWKDAQVDKEHSPAKQTNVVTFRQLENQVTNIDSQISELGTRKSALVAEMAKVKSAVEA